MGLDPSAVHADDVLLDVLGSGRPDDAVADCPVVEVLVAWREDVDSAPIEVLPESVAVRIGEAPRHAAEPPRLEWLGSVARGLAWLPASREDWRELGSWLGDLLEDFVAAALIAALWVIGVGLAVAVALLSPWWLRVLLAAGLATGWEIAVRLRRASRKAAEIERDELGEAPYAGWPR